LRVHHWDILLADKIGKFGDVVDGVARGLAHRCPMLFVDIQNRNVLGDDQSSHVDNQHDRLHTEFERLPRRRVLARRSWSLR